MKTHLYYTSILLFILLVFTACSGPKQAADASRSTNPVIPLTIGTYTKATSEGIYQADFNTSTGELGNLRLLARVEQPSFLALSGNRDKIYAVSEIDEGKLSMLSKQKDGSYSLDQEITTEGSTTCHVTLNKEESLVAVANYRAGSLIVYNQAEGQLSKAALFKHEGSSVHYRQKVPHPHSAYFSKNEKYLYVPDLGTDEIMAYPIIDGQPTAGKPALQMEPGEGPRHMAPHPTKDWWFVVGELSSVIRSLRPKVNGTFELVDQQNLLPEQVTGRSNAADVHVSPDGRYLYASIRGHTDGFHGIAVFQILDSGKLKFQGHVTEGINQPRNFCLSPDGRFLLVANQYGDNIVVFKVMQDGMLEFTDSSLELSMPACLKF